MLKNNAIGDRENSLEIIVQLLKLHELEKTEGDGTKDITPIVRYAQGFQLEKGLHETRGNIFTDFV